MSGGAQREPRTLIVVTRDFGEFSLAVSFLRGQRFARTAQLLLPDNLLAFCRDAAPVPASPYQTGEDILAAVDRHQSDLVCLFSGYLFETGGLMSHEAVGDLVRQLRRRTCSVATSDPFLGLAGKLTLGQVDFRLDIADRGWLNRWLSHLALSLRNPKTPVVRPGLDDVTHLYPTAIPVAGDGVPRAAWADRIAADSLRHPPTPTHTNKKAEGDKPPSWLFLLASADLQCQIALQGRRRFERMLAKTLWHALAAGRLPTLIAPGPAIDRLRKRLPQLAELLPGCPFKEFERRLVDAEYVFYWNAFSFSQLMRLARQRPIFLFDRGHLSRTVQPYYQLASATHYGGWEPPCLDQRLPLDRDTLARLATEQLPALRDLCVRWSSAPSADEVVERLVRERAAPAAAKTQPDRPTGAG